MNSLVKYNAARHALQMAWQIDEVKEIRDQHQALAAYAKQANDSDLFKYVTDIKLRAERRAGEILLDMKKNKGGPVRSIDTTALPPTLEDIGISKDQSSQFQAIATIPEEKFEEELATGKATTASMVRTAKGKPKKAKKTAEPKHPKAKPKDDDAPDFKAEFERADREIRSLQTVIESLQKSDLEKEVTKWAEKYAKLEGRVRQLMTTEAEAKKQAQYFSDLLAKIRKALTVSKNAEILEAIRKS